jgi:hypothetical protein
LRIADILFSDLDSGIDIRRFPFVPHGRLDRVGRGDSRCDGAPIALIGLRLYGVVIVATPRHDGDNDQKEYDRDGDGDIRRDTFAKTEHYVDPSLISLA